MRIVLASIHPRALSGQIEGLVGLAQALKKNGHAVQVVSAFSDQQLLSDDRLKLARRPARILFDQPTRMTRIFTHLIRLAGATDVIQMNLPTPAFSIFADLLQSFVRVPVVVGYEAHLARARDLLRPGRWRQSPGFYLPRLLINNRLVARFTLRRAAAYVVNTRYQQAELVSLGVRLDRIAILPTVLPHDKLARVSNAPALPLPPGRLVTYVGHYNPVKGVDVLLLAFQALAPRYPDLHLVLAWSGIGAPQRVRKLARALAGRVSELGQVCVPDLMRASTVVVLPYRLTIGQAAQPATLLEAIAANVPIVTTDLPLLREMTEEGRMALLVPPENPAALALGIERALNETDLVRRTGAAQREWIQRVQPEQVIPEYEKLYDRVVAGRQAAILRST